MDHLNSALLDEIFLAVGDYLAAAGASAAIVVVGGSALAIHGWVDRVTSDVDVIAQGTDRDGRRVLIPAQPLPASLLEAVRRVARDYNLPEDWLNTVIGAQWDSGLPEGFADEVQWRRFGALEVGLAGRNSMIALKLFAAVDQGPTTVHFQDLATLQPTER